MLGHGPGPLRRALHAVRAYFIISHRLNRSLGYANRLILYSVVWLVATAGFTSWEGHLGGLLAGGALTAAYAYAPARRRTFVHVAAAAGLLILAMALVALKTAALNTST
jgi:hypothetical protein